MTWTQVYDPFGHWWLSTLVAALPIVILLALLAGFRVKPHWSALAGAGTALLIAILAFGMPVSLASVSFLYGIAFGLLKIAWIVVAAVFLYDISVETGQFEIMKASIARITPDGRLQLLLVAFCFGAFIEGAAGFGSPVAIAGAFMIGLGFQPFHAAALNLIANTAPVAWGAIGTPVHTLAAVSGLNESDLSAMIGRILPFTAALIPLWLVRAMVSWSETVEVLPAILVVGVSFAVTQFAWSNFRDSNLVDIASAVVSIVCTIAFLKIWQPKHIWRFDDEPRPQLASAAVAGASGSETESASEVIRDRRIRTEVLWVKCNSCRQIIWKKDLEKNLNVCPKCDRHFPIPSTHTYSAGQTIRAWMPFAVLSLVVLLWGLPSIKTAINKATTPAYANGGWNVPFLHQAVYRSNPVVPKPIAESAKFDFNWLSATGTGCFLAAIVAGLLLGVRPRELARIFRRTLYRMRFAVLAISAMLGLGYITRYSGMDAVLGLAFTRTGWFYPFFGTFLGWLGVALTGSDTSSNALFGSLQRITAQQLNLDPILMAAANSAGGVMGKMVDAQSIIVATSATNQVGNEGQIFRFVVWHSIALGAIVGVIVMLYAYVFPHAVPHGLTFIK